MPIYRRLEPDRIVATTRALAQRVEERFPGSSLAAMARELTRIAGEAQGRLETIARPNWPLRVLAGLAVALLLGGLVAVASSISWSLEGEKTGDLVQAIEAAINDIVFIAVALFFIVSLETRLARRKVLAALHELRSMAHILDMHQLTKDPEHVLNPAMARTSSSPVRAMTQFELSRYLAYCSEMLSLVGKVAALHAQDLRDPVVLSAVNDVETLTVGLSRKIWQKITIIDQVRSDQVQRRAGEIADDDD